MSGTDRSVGSRASRRRVVRHTRMGDDDFRIFTVEGTGVVVRLAIRTCVSPSNLTRTRTGRRIIASEYVITRSTISMPLGNQARVVAFTFAATSISGAALAALVAPVTAKVAAEPVP